MEALIRAREAAQACRYCSGGAGKTVQGLAELCSDCGDSPTAEHRSACDCRRALERVRGRSQRAGPHASGRCRRCGPRDRQLQASLRLLAARRRGMNPRWRQLLFIGLAAAVLVAAVFLPLLRRSVKRSARLQVQSEEQAPRELLHPTIVNSSEPRVKTTLLWSTPDQDGTRGAASVKMPPSNYSDFRAKAVLGTP